MVRDTLPPPISPKRAGRIASVIRILQDKCKEMDIQLVRGPSYHDGQEEFKLYFQSEHDKNLYQLLSPYQNGCALYPWVMKLKLRLEVV